MTEAWAICEDDQIDVRTVSPTRQAAMIKCGELWTDTCEEKIGAALAKAREEQS